jgi:hypothetical protein
MICFENTFYHFLSHIGFGGIALSYLINDIIYMRLCLSISSLVLILWGLLSLPEESCYSTIGWNLLFFLINICYTIYEYKKLKNKITMN